MEDDGDIQNNSFKIHRKYSILILTVHLYFTFVVIVATFSLIFYTHLMFYCFVIQTLFVNGRVNEVLT